MSRKCDSWIKTYMEFSKEQESPEYYHLWSGLSILAATLGRDVWLDRGFYILFPNLYVVLMGPSGRTRKSTSIRLAALRIYKKALEKPAILSQRMTPEALVEALIDEAEEHGEGRGFLVCPELSVTLSGDPAIIQLLTDLYDTHEENFVYRTITRGKRVIEKPIMNLLGGSTPEWIKTAVPEDAVGGGFTSRLIFVQQESPRRRRAFPEFSEKTKHLMKQLIHDLKQVAEMEGPFSITGEGKDWFTHWYESVLEMKRVDGLGGYYARKGATLLKVAMCLSASEASSLEIEENHLRIALDILNENERAMPNAIKSVEVTPEGALIEKVQNQISKYDRIPHSKLLQHLSYCANAKTIAEAVSHLKQADLIEEEVDGSKRFYRKK